MAEISIYTLAKELNMTPSMVSRAFNPSAKICDEKRKIVLAAAKKYNFSPNKLASRLSMKAVRIGILINGKFKKNIDKMIAGIKTAHEELKDYKIKYDITILNPLVNAHEDFCQTLERYKSYDGIILSGMSADNYTELINELYSHNRNIVQVQAINQCASHLFASKHDEKTASALAAEFLYDCLKKSDRKNVLLFTGDLKSNLHLNASETFKDSCKELGLNLLSVVDMEDSEEKLDKILPDVFKLWDNKIDGIYITSGLSAPLCRYLEENALDIPFVAFDTYDEIKAYMKKGVISATISQNVANQMKVAFETLVKHLSTGTECPKNVYTDVQLVLRSNIHQFN